MICFQLPLSFLFILFCIIFTRTGSNTDENCECVFNFVITLVEKGEKKKPYLSGGCFFVCVFAAFKSDVCFVLTHTHLVMMYQHFCISLSQKTLESPESQEALKCLLHQVNLCK